MKPGISKALLAVLVAGATAIAVTACGGSDSNGNASGGGNSSGPPKWAGVYAAKRTGSTPAWCGDKEVSLALADGFADNNWRQVTDAEAVNEASKCPNVTSYTHTDGQGNTQKAISDIQGLAAKGTNAIVVFPDAGKAVLPAITAAYKQGSVVIPYRAQAGGKPGTNWTAFVGTDFQHDGVVWAQWMAKALHGKGNVAYLGGPPGTTESLEKAKGIESVFKNYPGIKWIGQRPFVVTNWDPALTTKALSALVAKYPKIDGVIADLASSVGTSFNVFRRAGKPLPAVAGEDSNALGCTWKDEHSKNKNSTFEVGTTSSETWNVRVAIQAAVAHAAGGTPPKVSIVKNYPWDDSLNDKVQCNPQLPEDAFTSAKLTVAQQTAALK